MTTADVDKRKNFESLRNKLEYLKREKDIELYHEKIATSWKSSRDFVEKFADILIEYESIFGENGELGCFPVEVNIETKGDPISIRQHAINQAYQSDADLQIKSMFENALYVDSLPIKDEYVLS